MAELERMLLKFRLAMSPAVIAKQFVNRRRRHETPSAAVAAPYSGHLTENGRLYGRPNGTPAVTV